MKNKITTIIISFLLLIPFRLPISILFIKFFQWIISVTTNEAIPVDILATNVIVTKLIYNIAISASFIYTLEVLSREKNGRKAHFADETAALYWWNFLLIIPLIAFIIIDSISIYSIFYK